MRKSPSRVYVNWYLSGGKIDLAHHSNRPGNSLREVLAFSEAIQVAADMTDESDTLIVVTADHSHSFTMNGYPYISNDIMGKFEYII